MTTRAEFLDDPLWEPLDLLYGGHIPHGARPVAVAHDDAEAHHGGNCDADEDDARERTGGDARVVEAQPGDRDEERQEPSTGKLPLALASWKHALLVILTPK